MKAVIGVILCRLSKSGHRLMCIGASTKQEARQPDVLQGQLCAKVSSYATEVCLGHNQTLLDEISYDFEHESLGKLASCI